MPELKPSSGSRAMTTPAVIIGPPSEIDVVADQRHFAGRRGLDIFRRNRLGDRGRELVLDLAIGLGAERHHGALTRADDAGDHRHVVADDVVEIERGLGLVDQGGDMADVDRLVQVDKLAVLPQAVEELAEILLHKACLPLVWPGKLMSPARKRNQTAASSGQGAAALGANVTGNG